MSYGMLGRGDYGTYHGDPGLFGFIKKVGGGLIKRVIGGTPIGMGLGAIVGAVAGKRAGRPIAPIAPPTFPGIGQRVKVGGLKGIAQRLIPGGATGFVAGARRRRMNVANPKALRKAIRRQAGFVKLARKALKGSGYTITARGARGRRPAVHISETGPGSVRVSR